MYIDSHSDDNAIFISISYIRMTGLLSYDLYVILDVILLISTEGTGTGPGAVSLGLRSVYIPFLLAPNTMDPRIPFLLLQIGLNVARSPLSLTDCASEK